MLTPLIYKSAPQVSVPQHYINMSSSKRVSKPPSSTSHRTMQPRRRLKDLIDSNRARENELTPYERGIIQGFNMFGAGSRQISDELEIPQSTVQRILEETPLDQGGPARLSSRDERTILCALRTDPSISYKEIRKKDRSGRVGLHHPSMPPEIRLRRPEPASEETTSIE